VIKVLYHKNCLDGLGAAYAVWMFYGNLAEYIPVTYNEDPPDVTGADVIIVDFSYKRDVLLAMKEKAHSLLVLDHHKTAKEDLEGLPFAHFDMEMSGAVMAWKHFHRTPVPYILELIQDRDLWTFKHPETRHLTAALYAKYDEGISLIRRVADADSHGLRVLIDQGIMLNNIFDKEVKQYVEDPLEITLHGYKGLVVNAPGRYASEVGHHLADISGTFGGIFYLINKNKTWAFSLRSVKGGAVDVSAIAGSFGGGGHFNAAGCSLTTEQFIASLI